MRNTVFFLLLAVCVITPLFPAVSQNSPYNIQEITISLPSGGNTSKKRDSAIQKATKQGLNQLLQNITSEEEWVRHPDILSIVDWNTVLEKFVIVKEETSPRYNLTLDLFFSRNVIRSLLHDLKIPYAESQKLNLLVLPLMDTENRILLWEENNPWRTAIESTTTDNKLLEFIAPIGDMNEVTNITAEMVNLGAEDILLSLAAQYNADGVIVSRLRTVYGYNGQPILEVENSWYGTKNAMPTTISYPMQIGEGFEESLQKAAQLSYKKLEETWQKSGVIQLNQQGKIFIRYSPEQASDLERLSELLKSFNTVKSVELRVLNIENSLFQVTYFGDEQNLANIMTSNGLELSFHGSLWWVSFKKSPETPISGLNFGVKPLSQDARTKGTLTFPRSTINQNLTPDRKLIGISEDFNGKYYAN